MCKGRGSTKCGDNAPPSGSAPSSFVELHGDPQAHLPPEPDQSHNHSCPAYKTMCSKDREIRLSHAASKPRRQLRLRSNPSPRPLLCIQNVFFDGIKEVAKAREAVGAVAHQSCGLWEEERPCHTQSTRAQNPPFSGLEAEVTHRGALGHVCI